VKVKAVFCFFRSFSKKDPDGIANGASHRAGVPLSRANLRIWSKKVLDLQLPILVTLGKKRSKNFLEKWFFGVQLPAFLIARSAEDRIRSLGKARDLRCAPACAFD